MLSRFRGSVPSTAGDIGRARDSEKEREERRGRGRAPRDVEVSSVRPTEVRRHGENILSASAISQISARRPRRCRREVNSSPGIVSRGRNDGRRARPFCAFFLLKIFTERSRLLSALERVILPSEIVARKTGLECFVLGIVCESGSLSFLKRSSLSSSLASDISWHLSICKISRR